MEQASYHGSGSRFLPWHGSDATPKDIASMLEGAEGRGDGRRVPQSHTRGDRNSLRTDGCDMTIIIGFYVGPSEYVC